MEDSNIIDSINTHFSDLKVIINDRIREVNDNSKINITRFIAAPYHLYVLESLVSEILKIKDNEIEYESDQACEAWEEADSWHLAFDHLCSEHNDLSKDYHDLLNKYDLLKRQTSQSPDISIAINIIRLYDRVNKMFDASCTNKVSASISIDDWNVDLSINYKETGNFSPYVIRFTQKDRTGNFEPIILEYNATKKPEEKFDCDGIGVYYKGAETTAILFPLVKPVIHQINAAIDYLRKYSGEIT